MEVEETQYIDTEIARSVVFERSVEIPKATPEIDILVVQIDQGSMAGMEEMMRQLPESMRTMQEDAAHQAEFAKQPAVVMGQ